jgi:Bacterial regulatory helix-turn-helix protein, lysR family
MEPSWGHGWSIGLRVWVERGGQAILGQGRLELLEGIDRWHSISAAARHMGMSYRRAWEQVQSINTADPPPARPFASSGTYRTRNAPVARYYHFGGHHSARPQLGIGSARAPDSG